MHEKLVVVCMRVGSVFSNRNSDITGRDVGCWTKSISFELHLIGALACTCGEEAGMDLHKNGQRHVEIRADAARSSPVFVSAQCIDEIALRTVGIGSKSKSKSDIEFRFPLLDSEASQRAGCAAVVPPHCQSLANGWLTISPNSLAANPHRT